jgi:phosphatidylglycerol---prolipoprotein diacylglyceryl transferase
MSYPYLSDLFHALLHIDVYAPIPMFGIFVAFAVLAATSVFRRAVLRAEDIGRLPGNAHLAVGDLAWVTLIAGILGARIFHVMDHLDVYQQDPAAMVFSRGGFSIFGGLCFGLTAGIFLVRLRDLPVVPMLDAVAPALMLGYAIGRIGCQVSGDGDWGIIVNQALKPEWLPTWLWAQTYDGNILGVTIAPPGVYPTPLYETAAAFLLFSALRWWTIRTRPVGSTFAMYLILTGFERLLIEKIRVNPRLSMFGVYLTQAELISIAAVTVGSLLIVTRLTAMGHLLRLGVGLGLLALLSACVVIG